MYSYKYSQNNGIASLYLFKLNQVGISQRYGCFKIQGNSWRVSRWFHVRHVSVTLGTEYIERKKESMLKPFIHFQAIMVLSNEAPI